MIDSNELDKQSKKKHSRKATPGGWPKLINIPRNWLHQAFFYMDTGERTIRVFVILIETLLLCIFLGLTFPTTEEKSMCAIAFLLVYTWNWLTNGLFWALIIFTFPHLNNPGAKNTLNYLNDMKKRLSQVDCISGVAIYGSVTRGQWHNRSDIDIRFLRRPGLSALLCATITTMKERFLAFINKQPMDLFLADDVDFLKKMRSDEIPLFTICRDERLKTIYPGCTEQEVQLTDLLGNIDSCDT